MSNENKMGVMPVNKLLINVSLPMMISMVVQALYNVVDSIFVAKISEDALSAVSLAFPIQNLLIAVGGGTGVGMNALLSKSLGEKKQDKVNKVAMNGVFLAIMSYLVFVLIGLFFVKPFYASQVTDVNSNIYTYGVEYLSIVCLMSFGILGEFVFERLLQSTGKTIYTMVSQGAGAIINIILDPILIFGYCGMPELGVAGAAIATVIGQIASMLIALYFNMAKNHEIQLKLKNLKPDMRIIGRIYAVGVPSIIMQSIGSVMNYAMNRILIGFTSTATAVFGVYYKLQSFFFMPIFGLNNGLVPIVAYNYGAGKRSRMMKAIKWSMVYAFAFCCLGFALFMIIPDKLFLMFDASAEMLSIGIPALRIIAFHYLIAWFCIICSTVFQALGNGVYSLVVSVARQLVVLLPAAYILAKLGGLSYVWWSFPIAEVMSMVVSLAFLIIIYKKIISKVPDNI